jgi:FG-GAP-like repeat
MQIGVDWSGVFDQSKAPSEWNVIQKSGSSIYRVGIFKDEWYARGPSDYDKIFQRAAERNITVLPYLVDGGYPTPANEPAWKDWTKMCEDLVKRYGYSGTFWAGKPYYKPVTAWELGNEPNLKAETGHYGEAGPNPTRYAEFLKAMSSAVRNASQAQAGTGTTVLMGGLYLGPVGADSTKWDSFLNSAYGVSEFYKAFDGISIHPYGFDYAHGEASKKTISEVTAEITGIRSNLASKTWGPSRTLWVTEIGWPVGINPNGATGVDDSNQSRLLTESFNWIKSNASSNKIESLIWYNLRDDNSKNLWQARDGLLRGDASRSARPAWTAFQAQTGATSWTPPAEQAPAATTNAATNVGYTSATLNGTINPQGLNTEYTFEYGTTPGYGSAIPVPRANAGEDESSVPVSIALENLQPKATYYYRLVANNGGGATYGSGTSFTTGCPIQAYSNGGFAGSSSWGSWKSGYTESYADVNGDCRADMVGWNSTSSDVQVGLSTGTKFNFSTSWGSWNGNYSRNFADVDGDGRADMVGWNSTTGDVQAGISTGSKLYFSTSWGSWGASYSRNFADVNGDGKADMVGWNSTTGDVQVGLSTGTKFAFSTSWGTWGASYSQSFADVNGDGKADMVGWNSTTGDVQVGLSTGTGFYYSASWGSWGAAYSRNFADVNGDGKVDMVGWNSTTNDIQAGLSNGFGFYYSSSWGSWKVGYARNFADVNGDGRADMAGWNTSTGDVQAGIAYPK